MAIWYEKLRFTTVVKSICLFLTFLIGTTESVAQNYQFALGATLSSSIATAYSEVSFTPEMPRLAMGGGIDAKVNLNPNLYFSSGIYILDKGFVIEDVLTTEDGSEVGFYAFYEHNYFLSLPAIIIFQRNHLFIGGGPNFNFLLHRNTKIEGVDEDFDIDFRIPDFLVGNQLTCGFEAPIGEKLLLSAALMGNVTFDFNLINYGVDFGVKYALNSNR